MREQVVRVLVLVGSTLFALSVMAIMTGAYWAMPVLAGAFAQMALVIQTQFWVRARQLLAELRTRVRRETARASGQKTSGMTTPRQSQRKAWGAAAVGAVLWGADVAFSLTGWHGAAWAGVAGLWLLVVVVQLRSHGSLRRRIRSIARPSQSVAESRSEDAQLAGTEPSAIGIGIEDSRSPGEPDVGRTPAAGQGSSGNVGKTSRLRRRPPQRPSDGGNLRDYDEVVRKILESGVFSMEAYRSRLVASGADSPNDGELISHFLSNATDDSVVPVDYSKFADGVTIGSLKETVRAAENDHAEMARRYEPLIGASDVPTSSPELDNAVEEFSRSGEAPLVSVVLPTWNRAPLLPAAVASVQRQSYASWELLIVDDGSLDDTESVVTSMAARDERIRYIQLPHRGVSHARNQGLLEARGEFVAFLDSDKEWDPEFLRTMVAVLVTQGHDVAFAACEVTIGGETVLRAVAPTAESLKIGNSVDQTAIVASRHAITAAGAFDESLRRAVDYDLVVKLSSVADMYQVPFIGLRYSEADSDPNRISEFESKAWNFYVADRQAWMEFESSAAPQLGQDVATVILDNVGSAGQAQSIMDGILDDDLPFSTEFIIIPRSHDVVLRAQCRALEFSVAEVRVLNVGYRGDRPSYINEALRQARGDRTLILDVGTEPTLHDGGLQELNQALEDAAVVHPVVLGRTLVVEDAGVVYPRNGHDPVSLLTRMPADSLGPDQTISVPGAPFPLMARTRDLHDVRGLSTQLAGLWADVDLSQKLAERTNKPVRTVAALKVRTERPGWAGRSNRHPDDVRTFREMWPTPPVGTDQALAAVDVDAVYSGYTAQSFPGDPTRWTEAHWMPASTIVTEPPRAMRWAIRTGAPASRDAANWGDYHYANSLADALRRAGQYVHVDFQENALRGTTGFEDVVVNLRGLRDVPIPGDATSILWIISHPEEISAKELEKYDLRYAASMSWARTAAEQWGLAVEPLLQCTDAHRFFPPNEQIPALADQALMVGNSRRQYRPAAWHAAHAGVPLSIWGKDWESQVPEEVIAGETLPNEELARYYSSAKWVLNDHWPQMRDEGFISNRIFDVLAAGGRLVTDDVVGLEEVFGDQLAVFASPRELLQILDRDPEEFYPRQVREELSAMVREQHSFDARARRLVDDVRRVRAARQTEQMVTHDD